MIDENKKQLVLSILKKLIGVWDLAEGLYVLINSQYITNEAIDGLILILKNSIKTLTNNQQLEVLNKAIKKLEMIKNAEMESKAEESNELEELEELMEKC